MSVIAKIPKRSFAKPTSEFPFEDEEFGSTWPGIFEVIARQRWEGNPRKTGKLLLFVDCEKASLMLSDVSAGMVAFYKSESFSEALSGLEGALQRGTVDWRPDRRVRA